MGQYLDKLKRMETGKPAVPPSTANHIVIEPAAANARPIYWETGDCRILGPVVPEFLMRDRNSYWIVTTFQDGIWWINADQLRSKKAFEEQAQVREVQTVREDHR